MGTRPGKVHIRECTAYSRGLTILDEIPLVHMTDTLALMCPTSGRMSIFPITVDEGPKDNEITIETHHLCLDRAFGITIVEETDALRHIDIITRSETLSHLYLADRLNHL